jgi:hypothetical protein
MTALTTRPAAAAYYVQMSNEQLSDKLVSFVGKAALGLATDSTRSCFRWFADVVRERNEDRHTVWPLATMMERAVVDYPALTARA